MLAQNTKSKIVEISGIFEYQLTQNATNKILNFRDS